MAAIGKQTVPDETSCMWPDPVFWPSPLYHSPVITTSTFPDLSWYFPWVEFQPPPLAIVSLPVGPKKWSITVLIQAVMITTCLGHVNNQWAHKTGSSCFESLGIHCEYLFIAGYQIWIQYVTRIIPLIVEDCLSFQNTASILTQERKATGVCLVASARYGRNEVGSHSYFET